MPSFRRSRRTWLAAASVIVIACMFFIYRFVSDDKKIKPSLSIIDTTLLQPGGNRATLAFADGSVIDLAMVKNGIIQSGEGSHVSKPADGELVYGAGTLNDSGNQLHTLSTPVGGQYQLTLQDGTQVWLNAATTLKYPSKFSGSERRIELDGEAYFEVAKNEKQPFRVILGDSTSVNVIGTHFNVMSYGNENAKSITLIEGKVLVKKENKTEQLKPGMQARVSGGELSSIAGVDLEEVTGWKKGLFVFHDAPIESIMRQVERWYDAKVVYQGEINQLFNATILRGEPLSKLLRLLELNGYVHFKIENKTIYVLP